MGAAGGIAKAKHVGGFKQQGGQLTEVRDRLAALVKSKNEIARSFLYLHKAPPTHNFPQR